jgi:hypothetical protein
MSPKSSKVVDLGKSSDSVGHLYPVLRAADGEILDGFHRKDSDPSWPERVLENVTTGEEKLLVKAHANMGRRYVRKKERVELVIDLAELYEAQGLQVRAPFTFKNPDPRTGQDRLQTGYRNEIVDRIAEVLAGCLHKGTIQGYLKGTRFVQDKGPAPLEKKTRSEERAILREKGAWHVLRRFYSAAIRERFGRGFMKMLREEVEAEMVQGLEPSIRAELEDEYRQLVKQLKLEMEEELRKYKVDLRVKAEQALRMNEEFMKELREEVRQDLMKELEIQDLNLRNLVLSHERALRHLQTGEPWQVPVEVRKRLMRGGALTRGFNVSPRALDILQEADILKAQTVDPSDSEEEGPAFEEDRPREPSRRPWRS